MGTLVSCKQSCLFEKLKTKLSLADKDAFFRVESSITKNYFKAEESSIGLLGISMVCLPDTRRMVKCVLKFAQ